MLIYLVRSLIRLAWILEDFAVEYDVYMWREGDVEMLIDFDKYDYTCNREIEESRFSFV